MFKLRLLLALGLLLSACGGAQDSGLEQAELAEPAARAPASEPAAGRVALAEAQGEPHILWFWGAN